MMERGYVRVNGGQVHYRWAGNGTPVLLLHQTSSSSVMYEALGSRLAEAGFRAVAMDTPGFGSSDPLPQGPSVEGFAATVAQLLDRLEIAGPIPIVGHHTGALIAVEVAVSMPERVARLVLVGCPYQSTPEEGHRRKQPSRSRVRAVVPIDDGSHLLHEWNRLRALSPSISAELLQREFVATMQAPRYDAAYHAVWDYDIAGRIGRVGYPTLVVAGTTDVLYAEQAAAAAALPKGRLVEIAGGGVFMLDERVDEIAPLAIDFLREGA